MVLAAFVVIVANEMTFLTAETGGSVKKKKMEKLAEILCRTIRNEMRVSLVGNPELATDAARNQITYALTILTSAEGSEVKDVDLKSVKLALQLALNYLDRIDDPNSDLLSKFEQFADSMLQSSVDMSKATCMVVSPKDVNSLSKIKSE
jgi:hypothetical protein